MSKIIAKKGYTIEVTSWENDGDNYQTNKMVVGDKDFAIAILKLCQDIFGSCHHSGGIGNTLRTESGYDTAKETILNYMKANPILMKGRNNLTDNEIIELCMDYNSRLLGDSDYYYSRVFESGNITYLPQDVTAEEIEV